MKKSVLAAATLSLLAVSGMANAAFTDADASGNWTGNLEFNGTITNTTPIWKYQIPEATLAATKDWDAERYSGTVDGSQMRYSFDKNITVLEGVMKWPAATGGPGLQPVVTFGAPDTGYVWYTSNKYGDYNKWSLGIPVTVEAQVEGKAAGTLLMLLHPEVASQFHDTGNPNKYADRSYKESPDAFILLKSQPYYAVAYGHITSTASAEGAVAQSTLSFHSPYIANVSSAFVVKASGFKLTFPTASIPDAWTATLPISITVQ